MTDKRAYLDPPDRRPRLRHHRVQDEPRCLHATTVGAVARRGRWEGAGHGARERGELVGGEAAEGEGGGGGGEVREEVELEVRGRGPVRSCLCVYVRKRLWASHKHKVKA